MMENLHASRLIPSANIQATIHPNFPTDKISYIDHSIEKVTPCVVYPETADFNDLSSIEFVVHESSGNYIDLASLKLEVKLQILDADGVREGIAADTNVYFINNLLSSLFPILKVYINGVCVETNYHGAHIARLEHIMDIENSLASNRGLVQGLFPINSTQIGPTITNAVLQQNAGRIAFSKQNMIHMKGFLNLDIATANKWLLDQCNLRIVLEPARDSYCINAVDNATAYKKSISSIKLHLDRISPTPGGFINTTKYLQENNCEYIIKRHVVHSEILAANQRSITVSRPFQNRIPHKLYLFMVSQTSDAGVYDEDPLYYRHNRISNYRIMIDGSVLKDQDCSQTDGYVNVYTDSLYAHGAQEYFIPYEIYGKGGFVIVISTNYSQNNELSFEQKRNMNIHRTKALF